MQKWSFFSMGIMTGIIAVLVTVVVMQNHEPRAHAQAVDNTGAGLMMGIAASQANQNDVVCILWKHPAPQTRISTDRTDAAITNKPERLTLCTYQITNGARTMRLAAIRDVTFDMDVVEYHNDKPSVKDIIDELKKNQPREK